MQIIEVDGSQGEGGGQILRSSLTLAAIFQKPVRIFNIRAGRKVPGLRPQHLQSALVVSKMSGGTIKGAEIGSTEIVYSPHPLPEKFTDLIDVRTAGSISLIAQTIIPISIFGGVELDVEIRGGTEVPNSPTIDYLMKLVVPVYEKLGAEISLDLKKRGYYPRGGGDVIVKCSSSADLKPIQLLSQDKSPVRILSISRQLPAHVASRQAEAAMKLLKLSSLKVENPRLDSVGECLSPGSSILIYESGSDKFIGASALGERGKSAESVGEEAGIHFLSEVKSGASVDSHLADMLVTLLSCIPGKSAFRTSALTDHFSTNCEISKKITGCEIETRKSGDSWSVEIVGSPEKPN